MMMTPLLGPCFDLVAKFWWFQFKASVTIAMGRLPKSGILLYPPNCPAVIFQNQFSSTFQSTHRPALCLSPSSCFQWLNTRTLSLQHMMLWTCAVAWHHGRGVVCLEVITGISVVTMTCSLSFYSVLSAFLLLLQYHCHIVMSLTFSCVPLCALNSFPFLRLAPSFQAHTSCWPVSLIKPGTRNLWSSRCFGHQFPDSQVSKDLWELQSEIPGGQGFLLRISQGCAI